MKTESVLSFSNAVPFVIASVSVNIAVLNAWAALGLTLMGIAYTARRLWLSFNQPAGKE